jgi:hypothetical protein
MNVERRTKLLSMAVVGVLLFQIGLYSAAWCFDRYASVLFYLDPRIGISAWTGSAGGVFPNRAAWLSAVPFALAALNVVRRPTADSLKIYVIVEGLLAAPSLAFMGMVLFAHLSPAHGFSIRELGFPVAVFVVASGAPWLIAWSLLRRQ